MNAWFDRLNLQPQERRMVLVGIVVVALLLNYWLIWPYVGEHSKVMRELDEVGRVENRYRAETGKTNAYVTRLKDLQTRGAQVAGDDAANRLQAVINSEASVAGVQLNRVVPSTVAARSGNNQTNQFFDDLQVTVDLVSGENELVNFLYRLGAGDSMVRVRDVSNLRLDPTQTRLQATLTLVASVQKKASAPPVQRPTTVPTGPTPAARVSATNRPPK
jgi:type II secretory pathway component PulM